MGELKELQNEVSNLETRVSIVETNIKNILSCLEEIKYDIREIRKDMDGGMDERFASQSSKLIDSMIGSQEVQDKITLTKWKIILIIAGTSAFWYLLLEIFTS